MSCRPSSGTVKQLNDDLLADLTSAARRAGKGAPGMRTTTSELTVRGEHGSPGATVRAGRGLLLARRVETRPGGGRPARPARRSGTVGQLLLLRGQGRPAGRRALGPRPRPQRAVRLPRDPLGEAGLGGRESNLLLAEFEREFLGPAAADAGVETEVVRHQRTLEHDLSPEAVRLLRAFSASANRSCLHPNDRQRWNTFLVRVHQDESLFDPALLDEWLQQEGWPEDTVASSWRVRMQPRSSSSLTY